MVYSKTSQGKGAQDLALDSWMFTLSREFQSDPEVTTVFVQWALHLSKNIKPSIA